MSQVSWVLPQDLLQVSMEIMRPHGRMGNEGLALWMGSCSDSGEVSVSHVVEVHGAGVESHPLYLRLSRRAIGALTDLAEDHDVYLVGQVHSHPETYTELSELDKKQGIRVPDYLSVVCPHYAMKPSTRLDDCGIHVFEGGAYRRISPKERNQRIRLGDVPVVALKLEVQDD